jgi:hypothetical protein
MEKLAASGVVTQLVSKILGHISRVCSSQQKRGKNSYKHMSGYQWLLSLIERLYKK